MAEKIVCRRTASPNIDTIQEIPKLCLFLAATNIRKAELDGVLRPFFRHVEFLENMIDVPDQDTSIDHQTNSQVSSSLPPYLLPSGEVTAPSLAVMLFLPETGPNSAFSVQENFQQSPWCHHHTLQLQRPGSQVVLGKQEFHVLSRRLPLWSVCPAPFNKCTVRINIFVRRYNEMVEFYRLVTDTEMESQKPGFSIFPIQNKTSQFQHRHPSLRTTRYELALKQSSMVIPYPLTNAYLIFPVKDIQSLLTLLPSDTHALSAYDYLTHDPDGNAVVLHSITSSEADDVLSELEASGHNSGDVTKLRDKGSVRSESMDSGRFSDLEMCPFETSQNNWTYV